MAKKRGFLTLVLALVMAIGLTVPAWAEVTVKTEVHDHFTDTYEYEAITLDENEIEIPAALIALINEETTDAWKDEKPHQGKIIFNSNVEVEVTYRATEKTGVTTEEIETLFVKITDYDSIPDGRYYTDYKESQMTTTKTGSKLTYRSTEYTDTNTGLVTINEIRDDYYNRHHILTRLVISKGEAPRYYYNSTTTTTDTDAPQGSPKTFDPGVAVYAFSGLLSLGGLAVAKKRGR